MTAYPPRLHLGQPRVFSYSTDAAHSYEPTVYEDNHEEPLHMPEYNVHSTSTSPSPDIYHLNDTNSRIRVDKEDDYGLHYHYGKLWPSNAFGGHENPWTTTSSLNWTATAQNAALSPLLSAAEIQTPQFVPSSQGQAVHAYDSRISSHGRAYPTSPLATEIQPTFANSSNVLPNSDSPPLFGVPPSPWFLRSLKTDPSLAAHQRVPPEKISTYSELSPNIEFMERLKLEESYNPIRSPTPAVVPAAPQPTINTTTAQRSLPDVSTTTEKATSKTPTSRSGSGGQSRSSASASTTSASQTSTSALPKKRKRRKTAVNESQAPAASSSSAMSAEDTAKADSRKPSLACTFCRERKISCGRPPPGSTDDTCNQCARRSFKCVFLPEASSSKSRRRS